MSRQTEVKTKKERKKERVQPAYDSAQQVSDDGVSFMKEQIVVTHTIRQTEIPALLDSWVTNTPSVKIYPQRNCFCLYFRKNITCLIVGFLRICHVFLFCLLKNCVSVGYGRLLFLELYDSVTGLSNWEQGLQNMCFPCLRTVAEPASETSCVIRNQTRDSKKKEDYVSEPADGFPMKFI